MAIIMATIAMAIIMATAVIVIANAAILSKFNHAEQYAKCTSTNDIDNIHNSHHQQYTICNMHHQQYAISTISCLVSAMAV